MRKLIMQMNVSLDGCAEHTVAIADAELHEFATQQLERVDTLLFGRVTYELMQSYWPYARKDPNATRSMIQFAAMFNTMPKIVFSRTLQEITEPNTKLIRNNIIDEVMRLKAQPGKNLSITGIGICQELMRFGLIDEYLLLIQPIVWGKGKRLFDNLDKSINLKLLEMSTFKSGVVVLHYLAGAS